MSPWSKWKACMKQNHFPSRCFHKQAYANIHIVHAQIHMNEAFTSSTEHSSSQFVPGCDPYKEATYICNVNTQQAIHKLINKF